MELLHKSFTALGLPQVLVLENAAAFMSDEFEGFLKKEISPPYHLASNGLVDRAFRTLKRGLKHIKGGSLNTHLCQFLLSYQITPHNSTGSPPAELLMGRKLRTQLDLLLPDLGRKVQLTQDKMKQAHDAHSRQDSSL